MLLNKEKSLTWPLPSVEVKYRAWLQKKQSSTIYETHYRSPGNSGIENYGQLSRSLAEAMDEETVFWKTLSWLSGKAAAKTADTLLREHQIFRIAGISLDRKRWESCVH